MRRWTVFLIVLVVALVIVWDVLARVFGGPSATVSWVVIDAAYEWPAVAFAAGFLCGHLFWRAKE